DRHVLRYWILELEPALIYQLRDRGRRERLGDGCDSVECGGSRGQSGRYVPQSETLGVCHAALLHYRNAEARQLRLGHLLQPEAIEVMKFQRQDIAFGHRTPLLYLMTSLVWRERLSDDPPERIRRTISCSIAVGIT